MRKRDQLFKSFSRKNVKDLREIVARLVWEIHCWRADGKGEWEAVWSAGIDFRDAIDEAFKARKRYGVRS